MNSKKLSDTMNTLTAILVLGFVAIAASSVIPEPAKFESWEGRIVGGSDANLGQFPFQVSLRSPQNKHFCGATLVNNRWVVSAAHCTTGRAPVSTRVVVGTILRTSGGTMFYTIIVRNHPEYNANTLANDISMVQTDGPIQFTNLVQPLNLGSPFVEAASGLTVSGWGQTSHPGSSLEVLQWYSTSTLTNEDCRSRFEGSNAASVFDNTICTFSRDGQGNCMGDSGGPLALDGNLIGAVSWGIACAQGFPDVYARISSHRSWILDQM